jgi:hypothetical protein
MVLDRRQVWERFTAFAVSTYPGFGNLGFPVTLLGLAALGFPLVFGLQLIRVALGSRLGPNLPRLLLGVALVIAAFGFLVAYAVAVVGATRSLRRGKEPGS